MDRLAIFVPLAKADAAQRLVYGYFDETPDRSREVFDYATSKPLVESWSAEMQKASDGKSLGNIRGQHANIAAGKLIEISYDDDLNKVAFVAKIVDDNEWKKVEEGVYTGFSPGGKYVKRWKDGDCTRYTAQFRELSIVDVPCNPSATFTMVKADGVEEEIEFVLDKAYEPGNDATKDRADELAKAAGKEGRGKDFVVQARADLIAENASAELAKMASESTETDGDEDPAVDPAADLNAALKKADAAIAKAKTSEADAADVPVEFIDMEKVAEALKLITVPEHPLVKSVYTLRWMAELIPQFASLQQELAITEAYEGDAMTLAAKAGAIVKLMGQLLIEVTQAEVADMLSSIKGIGEVSIAEGDGMALATQIVDLVKADGDLLEKAGARNNRGDSKRIQTIHDAAVELGSDCTSVAEKAAGLQEENDSLRKTVADVTPRLDLLSEAVDNLTKARTEDQAQIAKLEDELVKFGKKPAPAKGVRFGVTKAQDSRQGDDDETIAPEPMTLEKARALPAGADRDNALIAVANHARHVRAN